VRAATTRAKTPEAPLSDQETRFLLLDPEFSTSKPVLERIDDISAFLLDKYERVDVDVDVARRRLLLLKDMASIALSSFKGA